MALLEGRRQRRASQRTDLGEGTRRTARLRALLGCVFLASSLLSGCVEAVVGWQVPNTGDVDVWIEEFPDGPDATGKVYLLNRTGEEIDFYASPGEDWGRVTLTPNQSGHYEASYGADLTVEYTDGEGEPLLEYKLCSDASSSIKAEC